MIGWYVHHHGRGHLHRALAVAACLDRPVTGLSSLPRPDGWSGPWVHLDRDDATSVAPTAGGALHWAPVGDAGLRGRMAAISAWIATARPALVVSDVSVEVALLARLHGVPVASMVLPGDRSDAAHRLGYAVSDLLLGAWPDGVVGLVRGLSEDVSSRIRAVGGLSRFPVAAARARRPGPPRVTVLLGAGGAEVSPSQVAAARTETPEWEWRVLGREPGVWVDDPYADICDADVVVTHAGENAIAEVAAARRPAVVVPAARPHAEQETTAQVLGSGEWPAVVLPGWPSTGWHSVLGRAVRLDGHTWQRWCDGDAARRTADLLGRAAATAGAGVSR